MQTKYLLLTPFKLKVAFNLKYQNFNLLKYIFKKYLICHNFLSSSYKGNRIKSIRINVNVTNAYSSEFHIHIYIERERKRVDSSLKEMKQIIHSISILRQTIDKHSLEKYHPTSIYF